MKKSLIFLSLGLCGCILASAQDYYDDGIYYNPKKDTKKKNSNYIADMASIDPDVYNRRGQYYTSPVDTIGMAMENGEDFVYTQAIQKFYNPTIILDNTSQLQDVLNNSYGNVNIVVENGLPFFTPVYNWYPYMGSVWTPYWGYSYGWYDPWYSPVWGPSWTWNWNWGPSWSWSWNWGPSWSWGWGPAWGPGWGHGPGWGGHPTNWHADYRPHGNQTVRPGNGYSHNTRPGASAGGATARPGSGWSASTRPGMAAPSGTSNNSAASRPGSSQTVIDANGHRHAATDYNGTNHGTVLNGITNGNVQNRGNATVRNNGGNSTNRNGSSVRNNSNSTNSGKTSGSSYNRNSSGSSNSNSTNRNSYNSTNRNSGSSYNSGSSTRGGGFSGGGTSRGNNGGGQRGSGGHR